MRPRIHIIGGPGSGKSFAAAALSARFDVPAYDLDDLFWAAPYRARAAAAERDRRLADLVARDGWIIEGAYHDWVAPSFDTADMIIELIPSLRVRQWRVTRRFALRKLGWAEPKRESVLDLWRLLCWGYVYERRLRAQAREFISARGRRLVACRTLDEVLAAASRPS